jgi:glycosyltransferase involved in cell wall biosynthesis
MSDVQPPQGAGASAIQGPSIAAVIPLYNKRAHVRRALLSVANQTSAVDEIIVVDDASSDGSLEEVRAVAAELARPVRILQRDRPGPGGYAARNLAIREASSVFIAFLDADDEWTPGHIDSVRTLLARHPEAVAAFASRWIVARERTSGLELALPQGDQTKLFTPSAFVAQWVSTGGCPMWTSATVIRRDTLIDTGLFPEDRCSRGGDKDLWLRVSRAGPTVGTAHVGAIYYNDTNDQVTRKVSVNACPCICHTLKAIIREAEPAARRDYARLMNREIEHYVRQVVGREPVRQDVYRDYVMAAAPLRYAALRLATAMPLGIQARLRQAYDRLRPAA